MAATMHPEHVPGDDKFNASHIDDLIAEKGFQPSASSDDEEYTPLEERKIVHRVDRRLVLTCGVMYCISLMDRINLGQAAIAGMTKALKLKVGFRYVGLPS